MEKMQPKFPLEKKEYDVIKTIGDITNYSKFVSEENDRLMAIFGQIKASPTIETLKKLQFITDENEPTEPIKSDVAE